MYDYAGDLFHLTSKLSLCLAVLRIALVVRHLQLPLPPVPPPGTLHAYR